MNKIILSITLATSAALLVACGGTSSTSGVVKAQEQSGGFLGLAKAADIKVSTPKAFAGIDKVTIGAFTVGFATYKTDSVKAGGGLMGNGFGGKSTARSTLAGVDDVLLQEITDNLYNNFVTDLQSRGIVIEDRSQLAEFAKFKSTKTIPSPLEDKSGGLFGASSITKYFAPSGFGGIKAFLGDIQGETGGFGFANPSLAAAEYAQNTGTKVLSVVYVVDFANADSYGGWHTSSSSISVGQGITVLPNLSKISLIGGQGGTFQTVNGNISLGQPITSMKEFATVVDDTTSTDKTVQVVTNVIGFIGGVGTNSSRNYTFQARPDDFKSATLDAVTTANQQLIDKLVSLK